MTPVERRLLHTLVNLPTAPGGEARVMDFVAGWAKRRADLVLTRDRFGNILLRSRGDRARRPLVLVAHADHPGFIVTGTGRDAVEAVFHGAIDPAYLRNARVRLHAAAAMNGNVRGRVTHIRPSTDIYGGHRATVKLDNHAEARAGDILTWDLKPAQVIRGRLHAPVTDNLTGLAAALIAMDRLRQRPTRGGRRVRLLVTRCEEVGCLGAYAAHQSGLLPRGARIVVLENTRCSREAPLGAGVIVRVGDRGCAFDPDLTHRVRQVAAQRAAEDRRFQWQYRLMTGGSCEASAFTALGYATACVCLPLEHYHNMQQRPRRIAREVVATSDLRSMIALLEALGRSLHTTPSLAQWARQNRAHAYHYAHLLRRATDAT